MRTPRQALIEDVEWLLGAKTDPAEIAVRLGKMPATIARALNRAGHPAAAPFNRLASLDRYWADPETERRRMRDRRAAARANQQRLAS